MRYSNSDIDRVKDAADIRAFIPGASVHAATQYVACPQCGKSGKGKGLCVTHKGGKDIAKCFSCDFTLNGAIDAAMYFDKVDFPEALRRVASQSGIYLRGEDDKQGGIAGRSAKKSFCAAQLEASGLTIEDVTAKVKGDDGTDTYVPTFRRGGMDKFFNVNTNDDEMLIYYFDLWGNAVQYATRGAAGRLRPYVRVRWSNPGLHTDGNGHPIKYQTPKGAPTKFYIPQRIRSMFQNSTHIETLIVQEGEKKAEKACKHGIASIGIQGIYNIGNAETGLIQDLQYLVQKCTIHNVVLLMDSDWDHLHKSLQMADHADQRPNQFAKAVIKFKQYVQTMHNIGISVDIFFGHINDNERHEKGIDDLLCGSLKGREEELAAEIDAVIHTHDGKGHWLDIYKISSKTDFQIKDYWLLNNRDAFFDKYKEQLLGLPNFRFGNVAYRVEEGAFVQATRYSSDRDFWSIEYEEKSGKRKVQFSTVEALKFINANGFYRIHTPELEIGQYKFVQVNDGIVTLTGASDIRNFIYNFVQQTSKEDDVLEFFASRLGAILGPDKLEQLPKIDDTFDDYKPERQMLFFRNGQLTVTAGGMDFGGIVNPVWQQKVINRKFHRVRVINDIKIHDDRSFTIELTEEGARCEFLQFLQNVSYFWRGEELTPQKEEQYARHLVNKITSIGFLLCDYKFQTELKAVIAMDGALGEVGQSNGRTGKSLIGVALSKITEQTVIDGRSLRNDDDFIYSNVTPRTRNIFMDDVRVNFDFERLYPAITGDLAVNPKGKSRFVIPNAQSPKIYIATNHAINATDRSACARIAYMVFSDWYNDTHTPFDDFHHALFADWDDEQWNLFDNLMAECVMYYLRSMEQEWCAPGQGMVQPPQKEINQRILRQQMGETFLQWAEAYFDPAGSMINCRLRRKDVYDSYHAQYKDARFGVTPSNFRKKLTAFCQYKGLNLNVSRPNDDGWPYEAWARAYPGVSFIGGADKANSVEYFTVSENNFGNAF